MKNLKCLMLCGLLLLSAEAASTTLSTYDEQDIECLASNIYHEARGEPVKGRIAVGFVTLNRVKSNKFPNTICRVVYQAVHSSWWRTVHGKQVPVRNQCQFSWYCDGRPDTIYSEKEWIKAISLAKLVLSNAFFDPTFGSTFYHADSVSPAWASSFTHTVTINKHMFYIAAN